MINDVTDKQKFIKYNKFLEEIDNYETYAKI